MNCARACLSARGGAKTDTLTGEAFVVPRDERNVMSRLKQATDLANSLDWRLHDINVVLVPSTE